jgi:hypothetical protein
MQLTQADIEEFKEIYQREFDLALSDAQALELATAALNLMSAIYRPLPEETCTSENSTLS